MPLKIRLKTTTGTLLCEIDFPVDPSEVTLSQFIDFQKAYERYQAWQIENESANYASFKYRKTELNRQIACVSAFCGVDVMDLPIGNFLEQVNIDLNETETSLQTLFSAIWGVLGQYKIVDFEGDYYFTYKGVKYSIPSTYKDAITKQERFTQVSTAQAVEALEAWTLYEGVAKEDADGGYMFKTILNMVACFAKSEQEDFPDSDDEIQLFLSNRIVHFKDLDMQTGLDIYNFFFGGLKPFNPTNDTSSFLSRQSAAQRTSTKPMLL